MEPHKDIRAMSNVLIENQSYLLRWQVLNIRNWEMMLTYVLVPQFENQKNLINNQNTELNGGSQLRVKVTCFYFGLITHQEYCDGMSSTSVTNK